MSSKYLGIKRDIVGNNSNIHNCEECGAKLSIREYNEVVDLCKVCKRKWYGQRNFRKENRIDEILVTKLGGEN